MKFSLNWLKDHLDFDMGLEELCEKLTRLGLEVEEVTDITETLKNFKVAEVLTAEQHPNANKLRVCTVNTGEAVIQVVCGAPNARAGMKGVFAPSGSYVPGADLWLKPTSIRGVVSNGMLCSEREMMLSEEHDGIIDLPKDTPVGTPFTEVAGLNDPVIEIAITPNRQDCLGVIGIARDLAAGGVGTLISKPIEAHIGKFKSPVSISLDFEKSEHPLCTQFVSRMVKGVKNGPSPEWLQKKLKAIGLKPISALVDITNFVTHDRGRPLHVYDASKLTGNIVVRVGEKGESYKALDEKTYTLLGGECVIADDNNVLGFGGIMGGKKSGVSEGTTDVLIESAFFDPISTALTGRIHGIESDARYRFERGVDTASPLWGCELATQLILGLCGGEASDLINVGSKPEAREPIKFRTSRVAKLGGLNLAPEKSLGILKSLGFSVGALKSGISSVTAPSWRVDIVGEADLVEEVVRIAGYDNIPAVPLPRIGDVARATLTNSQVKSRAAKRQLASIGMVECITWSFMQQGIAEIFGGGDKTLKVDNPISSELDAMRPSILPNLIYNAKRNADRNFRNSNLFEVGPQYNDDTPLGQKLMASGIRTGNIGERHWAGRNRPVDAYDAKSDAIAALKAAGAPVGNLKVFTEAPDWYHPGRSGTLRLGPKQILATFGELHPNVLKKLDIKGTVVGFEVDLNAIPKSRKKGAKAKNALNASDLQSVTRDFAFVVEQGISSQDVVGAVKSADKNNIDKISIFDVFEGASLGDGNKSVGVTVRLQPRQKTFTDDEIEEISRKITQSVEKNTSGTLR